MSRLVLGAAIGVAIGIIAGAALGIHAQAFDPSDTLAAIDQSSEAIGVSSARLTRVVGCETGHTFSPYAVGDHGTSFGAVQLHRGGNAWPAFFAAGYSDPTNPYEAVEFLARALRGDFPPLGVLDLVMSMIGRHHVPLPPRANGRHFAHVNGAREVLRDEHWLGQHHHHRRLSFWRTWRDPLLALGAVLLFWFGVAVLLGWRPSL